MVVLSQAHSVLPNEYVFGTLLGNAARSRSYEYLTSLLKKMLHLEVVPNSTILDILKAAAQHKPRVSITTVNSPPPTSTCILINFQ